MQNAQLEITSGPILALLPYLFEEQAIWGCDVGATAWFSANHVCKILDHDNPWKAVERLKEDEKGLKNAWILGCLEARLMISESGVHALALASQLPIAERFWCWMAETVLPRLRDREMVARDRAAVHLTMRGLRDQMRRDFEVVERHAEESRRRYVFPAKQKDGSVNGRDAHLSDRDIAADIYRLQVMFDDFKLSVPEEDWKANEEFLKPLEIMICQQSSFARQILISHEADLSAEEKAILASSFGRLEH